MEHAQIASELNKRISPLVRGYLLLAIAADGKRIVASQADSDQDIVILNSMADTIRVQPVQNPAFLWKLGKYNSAKLTAEMKKRRIKDYEIVTAEGGFFVRNKDTQELIKP